jgi:putative membrane protein
MTILILKSLHIIFVVTWFAALFYMVRLLIYHREAQDFEEPKKNILSEQFSLMERRLWLGISWPSAILTIALGLSLLPDFFPLKEHPWLHFKLTLIILLFGYHQYIGKIYKQFKQGKFSKTPHFLRILNELATVFLVAIVFLVELKNSLNFFYFALGLSLLVILLVVMIKFYQCKKCKS